MLSETLGMTVERLRSELSLKEYFGWVEYFKRKNEQNEPEKKSIFDSLDAIAKPMD